MHRILYILTLALLVSCGKTHKLSDSDIDIVPYEVNDVLIFESNDGLRDTIIITKVIKDRDRKEYLPDLNNTYFETFRVNVKGYSEPDSVDIPHIGLILDMCNYGEETSITFWFKGITKPWSISRKISASEFDTQKASTITTKSGTFRDVIIFESDTVHPAGHLDMINKVYWSLAQGYIKLEVNHEQEWTLIKKYSQSSFGR